MQAVPAMEAPSAADELIRGIIDDSALASAVLQSLTSMRASVETSLASPPSALISEAAEAASSLQNLCLRLRQRAADAQRSQLAVARAFERESAANKQLNVTKLALEASREEQLVLAQRLRDLEGRLAQANEITISHEENERLAAALRDREAALVGERELNAQLTSALHRFANEKEAILAPSAHSAAAEAAAEAALAHAGALDATSAKETAVRAMRARREATAVAECLRRELSLSDAEICISRVECSSSHSTLARAQSALATERAARARADEMLAASRRGEERLGARLAVSEEDDVGRALALRGHESEIRALRRELRQVREAAALEVAKHAPALHALEEKLERAERDVAATQAELAAERSARDRGVAQAAVALTAAHEEHSASSAAADAERAHLYARLEVANEARIATERDVATLRTRAHAATSLGEVVPALSALLAKLENSEDAHHMQSFLAATAATRAAASAAEGGTDAVVDGAEGGGGEGGGGHGGGKGGGGQGGGRANADAERGVRVSFAEHAAVDEAIVRALDWERECLVLRDEIQSLEMELFRSVTSPNLPPPPFFHALLSSMPF